MTDKQISNAELQKLQELIEDVWINLVDYGEVRQPIRDLQKARNLLIELGEKVGVPYKKQTE